MAETLEQQIRRLKRMVTRYWTGDRDAAAILAVLAEVERLRAEPSHYVCLWCGARCLGKVEARTHYCPDDPKQKEVDRLREVEIKLAAALHALAAGVAMYVRAYGGEASRAEMERQVRRALEAADAAGGKDE
jgi:uncharacterized protein (DUF2252 family)